MRQQKHALRGVTGVSKEENYRTHTIKCSQKYNKHLVGRKTKLINLIRYRWISTY